MAWGPEPSSPLGPSHTVTGKNMIPIMHCTVTVWEGPNGEDSSGPQASEGTSFTILDK